MTPARRSVSRVGPDARLVVVREPRLRDLVFAESQPLIERVLAALGCGWLAPDRLHVFLASAPRLVREIRALPADDAVDALALDAPETVVVARVRPEARRA